MNPGNISGDHVPLTDHTSEESVVSFRNSMKYQILLFFLSLLISTHAGDDDGVCHDLAKGDNSCNDDVTASEDDGVDLGKNSKHSSVSGGTRLISRGEMKWYDFDWRQYQSQDVREEDRLDPLKRFSINIVTSSALSPNRSVPDNRPLVCSRVQYDESSLPSTSVIITYRTEPRSTLLRTIVSVLERTPAHLLTEIIIVDDYNEDSSVGTELAKLEKVMKIKF